MTVSLSTCGAREGADPAQDQAIAALEAAGQPVVTLPLDDRYDLGGEFFRWEFATAVAGAFLQINAFNQPNVQEAKDKTDAILAVYQQTKTIPDPQAISAHAARQHRGGRGERHLLSGCRLATGRAWSGTWARRSRETT